ncbi:Alcohol oxidase [Termitomyces sp. J132]|nr:Alcohol oxidase [Termitomyces sp. J132]
MEHYATSADEHFDIIFVGGGAAACVTAGRLAQADPNLKILILETGPLTKDLPRHVQPARYFHNLMNPGETFTLHKAKPSLALAGREVVVPSARCLGGGSSVNFAMYTRAAASDYDDWEKVHENPGWGSKHLIPLLKKAETFQAIGDPEIHGNTGPIKASYGPDTNVASQFLEVARKYDEERKSTDDANGFFTCNAYDHLCRYIDAITGRRSDTPHNYIYKHTDSGLTELTISSILFPRNFRAVGVEHVTDAGRRDVQTSEPSVSYASRLIVISAGAFGSPAILERSGIGGADVLKRNKIEPIVDLPGVGEHYMDHNLIFSPYLASDDADTMDAIFRGNKASIEKFASRWARDGQGPMAQNGIDAGIKLRPNSKDLDEIGPEFKATWKNYFEHAPDKPVVWLGTFSAYSGNNPAAPWGKYFSATYFTGYPVSRGRVHISMGLNPYGKLDFEPGYLNHPADLGVLRWAYKKGRELARRMDIYRGEFVLGHPSFPKDSNATTKDFAQPVEISTPDIAYTAEDDQAIDEYHRKTVETTWHSIGTCAMKPREKGGVVDPRLNVYGVQNLKVADCSVAPANVGANTYNTALAIGEKAAVIIAEDLGIQGISPK